LAGINLLQCGTKNGVNFGALVSDYQKNFNDQKPVSFRDDVIVVIIIIVIVTN